CPIQRKPTSVQRLQWSQRQPQGPVGDGGGAGVRPGRVNTVGKVVGILVGIGNGNVIEVGMVKRGGGGGGGAVEGDAATGGCSGGSAGCGDDGGSALGAALFLLLFASTGV